jgi:hypothetical protein
VDFRRAVSIELRDVDRHTRWNGTGVDERDYLTAIGVTENLEAFDHEAGERRQIETLDVWIERVPVPEVEALLRVVLDRNAHPLPDWRAELYVRVPGPLYRDLVATAAGGVGRIAVTSRLPTRGGAVEMAIGSHAVKVQLEDVMITAERPLAMQAPVAAAEPFVPPAEAEFAALLETAVPGGRAQSPQLWQIGLELVRSAAEITGRPDVTPRAVGDDLGRLLVAVREAFRPVPLDGRHALGPAAGGFHRLDDPVGDAPDERDLPPVLAERVDPLWAHVPPPEARDPAHPALVPPPVDRLEAVAGRYCAEEHLASPTLEWAIVDALVHHATLHVVVEPPDPAADARRAFVARAKRVAIEAAWLAATAWAALLVAPGATTFWVIVLGVTAIRWLRPRAGGVSTAEAARREGARLAADLRAAYARVCDAAFNAGQVRSLLYGLESRGVTVNPWVYHVLDKRIRRGGEVR